MINLLALVAVVAAAVWLSRKVRARRKRKALSRLPGGSIASPIEVSSFWEIDEAVGGRRCWCGGRLVLEGEGSRENAGRRYRVSRLVCVKCDEETRLYFDVTRIYN